jgi:hypothetical protein
MQTDAPLALAARKLNAGRRRHIAEATLARLLRDADGDEVAAWSAHLRGLIEELPIESLHDLVLAGWTDFGRLQHLARTLGCEGDSVAWIDEMAEPAVADAS